MRALKHFAIALTPFILNAEPPKPIQVQEMPLILNVELPPAAKETPVATQQEPPTAPVVQQTPVVKETPVVTQQEPAAAPVMNRPALTNGNECLSPFHVMHMDVRHTESKGVGYKEGYTTLEGFGIYDHNPYFMPFLDLRGHVFNDGQFAANIGIGERTVIPSNNHIFGLYLYYDFRQEDHGLTVNQLSPGVEVVGKRMEYRINAYFPVGNDRSDSYRHKFERFQGNQIIMKQRKKFAMKGVDGEVGAHITQSTRHDFYFGIGPYYFTANPNNAWGGKTRLYWRYKDYVSLEASYSYDHIFKNVVQGTVAFSYPFGKKLERKGRNCPNSNDLALSRAAFAPYRFEIPVVETRKQHRAAVNPATGSPFRVWFVNNTSSSNGTFESPFSTLAAAQNASGPNDMIYVFQGNGTTQGMNTGIVLKNGQYLFGSGTFHPLNTRDGSIVIPALTTTAPSLTNAGSIITLANGNEVSGLNLLVTLAASVAINGNSGVNGANINQNIISGSVDYTGVSVVGWGNLLASNNVLSSPGSTANTGTGILFRMLDNQVSNVSIWGNRISGYGAGIAVTPLSNPTTARGTTLIAGNQVANFGSLGISYTTGMAGSTARIMNNDVANTIASGGFNDCIFVALNEAPDSGTVYITHNNLISTTLNVGSSGISASINLADNASARMVIDSNNIVVGSGAGSRGIDVLVLATDRLCLTLTNNIIQAGAGLEGIRVTGTGTVNIDDSSNNITPNTVFIGNVNLVAPGTCQN